MLDDASLRGTKFVLLHGGAGPFSLSIAPLLMKPNVYTDFSEQTWLLPTRELATNRFATGSSGIRRKCCSALICRRERRPIDWEEIGWQTTSSARDALAMALTGMLDDGEITRPRALDIANMVLRGNALRLYGWGS